MILKKPYAFLIKYFRLIHAILSILLIFITYNTRNIYLFIENYIIKSNYLKIYIEASITSIPYTLFIAIIFTMIICIIILLLMKHKSKPTKYYTISIIFYILFIIGLIFTNFQLASLVQNRGVLRLVMATRDIMKFFYYTQYVFIIIALVRTSGFDIKRFNFNRDLKELEIMSSDNEEFELDIEIDPDDVKAGKTRRGRLINYFFKENKKLLILIITGVLLILIGIFWANKYVVNKIYNEKESFNFSDLNLKIENSYETIYDINYNDISENKYKYYITKINIKNNTKNIRIIDLGHIRLNVSNKYYSPDTSLYKYFSDIGKGYNKEILPSNSNNNYILVFKVDKNDSTYDKTLQLVKNKNTSELNYTSVKLSPKNLDEVQLIKQSNLKENLNLEKNILGNIELKIDEYLIGSKFDYKYEEQINGNKYSFIGVVEPSSTNIYGKKILKLKYSLNYSDILNPDIMNKFFSNFGHIRYKINNIEYNNPFNIIQKEVNDKNFVYLEVTDVLDKAEEIYLDIIIRSNKYVYKLK